MDEESLPLTDMEISNAYWALRREEENQCAKAQQALVELNSEIYLSPVDRFAKEVDIRRVLDRLEDDLIVLGKVDSYARASRTVVKA